MVETIVENSPEIPPGSAPVPRRKTRRTITPRERAEQRISRETLVERAAYLPPAARALACAAFGRGIATEELALMQHISHRQMWRKLRRLRETLSQPCYLLTIRFADQLPEELALLARAHWIDGVGLRELAARDNITLHRVRHDLTVARSLLVVAMSGQQPVDPSLRARRLMCDGGEQADGYWVFTRGEMGFGRGRKP